MTCPKGGVHRWYSELAWPCRVQAKDWCTKCATEKKEKTA